MADGRHFVNHYISIFQPQIIRIARNLVCRHKFYRRRWKRQKKSEIANSTWRMDAALKITFGYSSAACCPLRWNLEWGGRITRIRSRSGDQMPNYENPI